ERMGAVVVMVCSKGVCRMWRLVVPRSRAHDLVAQRQASSIRPGPAQDEFGTRAMLGANRRPLSPSREAGKEVRMPARVVLQQADIQRALRRMSHEILEANHGGSDLVLLGIPTRGVMLAERIGANLDALEPGSGKVGSLDVTMYRDDLDRHPTRTPSPTRLPAGGIDGKTVVLVDDV